MSLFSPFVTKALVDTITGGSNNDPTPSIGVYRSGTKIEQLFLDCGLDMRIGVVSRVPATTEFLRRLAAAGDREALVRVVLRVADPRDYLTVPESGRAVVEHLNRALAPDGLAVLVVDGKPQLLPHSSSGAIVAALVEKTAIFAFDTVQREITRALQNAVTDPEDAVTAACSLVESVCRSVLVELGLTLPARKDVDGVIAAVQVPLGLAPGRTGLPPEIEADVRQVLGGLTSVAKGIGALRTHGGDAHGRERGFKRIDPRIARLSINAAGSLSLFLVETWETHFGRALPIRDEAA